MLANISSHALPNKPPQQLESSSSGLAELVFKPSLKVWGIYLILFVVGLVLKFILMTKFEISPLIWRWIVTSGVLYLGYLYARHVTTSYALNPTEVVGRSGLFSRRVIRIPLNRITNYDCHASLIDRLLGLRRVRIDTPGSTGFELVMTRLRKVDADRILGQLANRPFKQELVEQV